MTTPVKPEFAKLLKEKGFDYHLLYNDFSDYYDYFDKSVQGRLHVSDFPEDKFPDENKWTPVPYIYQVVMWLYERYSLWILPLPTVTGYFAYKIVDVQLDPEKPIERPPYKDVSANDYSSPTKAYEAAIEYVLKNLI